VAFPWDVVMTKRTRRDVLMIARGNEKVSVYHLVQAAIVIMREQRGRDTEGG
jgi:hypothetical protein